MCMCVCKQGPCCTLATSLAEKVAVQWRVVQDRVMVCTCVSLLGTPASEQGEVLLTCMRLCQDASCRPCCVCSQSCKHGVEHSKLANAGAESMWPSTFASRRAMWQRRGAGCQVLVHVKAREGDSKAVVCPLRAGPCGQVAAHEEPGEAGGEHQEAAGGALHHGRPCHPHARPGIRARVSRHVSAARVAGAAYDAYTLKPTLRASRATPRSCPSAATRERGARGRGAGRLLPWALQALWACSRLGVCGLALAAVTVSVTDQYSIGLGAAAA